MKTNCESVSEALEGVHPCPPSSHTQQGSINAQEGLRTMCLLGSQLDPGKHRLCTCEPWGWGEAAPPQLHLQLASVSSSYNVPRGWAVVPLVAPAAPLCVFSALGRKQFLQALVFEQLLCLEVQHP